MLYYHHARELEHVHHDIVTPVRLSHLLPEPPCLAKGGCDKVGWHDVWHDAAMLYEPAYAWLAQTAGFWPLFLSVGLGEEALYMTGYHNQFYKDCSENQVLFSFAQLPAPKVFSDYDWWHLALCSGGMPLDGKHERPQVQLRDYYRRMILKPSWKDSDWLRRARREAHTVQVVVPQLDLRVAPEIWCRNQKTRQALLDKGFNEKQVRVQRLKVRRW